VRQKIYCAIKSF